MTLRRYEPWEHYDSCGKSVPGQLTGEILKLSTTIPLTEDPHKGARIIDAWVGDLPVSCTNEEDSVLFFRDHTYAEDLRPYIRQLVEHLVSLGAKIPPGDWYESGFKNLDWPCRCKISDDGNRTELEEWAKA